LCFSLNIEVTGSHVPHKSPDRTLATSMPDADRAVNRHLPDLSCGNETPAVLTSSPRFDTSSVVHLRSTLRPIPDPIEFGLFLSRSPPRLLNIAAAGGLKPPPVRRLRGTYPHLLCSMAALKDFHLLCAPSWHTSSRPRELPPQALTEPYVNLSIHTALPIQSISYHKTVASVRTNQVDFGLHPTTSSLRAVGVHESAYTSEPPTRQVCDLNDAKSH
jgi:hypothetical protein